jgi:hypothetical protein
MRHSPSALSSLPDAEASKPDPDLATCPCPPPAHTPQCILGLPHELLLAPVSQVLEKALFAAGCISEANFGSFAKIRWSRASRTDKGVHSLGTVRARSILRVTPPEAWVIKKARTSRNVQEVCVRCCVACAGAAPTAARPVAPGRQK